MPNQSPRETTVDPPINTDELLQRCLGRIELVDRLLERFHDALDQDLEQLEQAFRVSDARAVAYIAHRIRGSSATVAAHALAQCAARLEKQAETGQLPELEPGIRELRSEYVRLADSMTSRQQAE